MPSSWEQPGVPGRNHDPHEVTVQLDGAGRRLDDRLLKQTDGGAGQEADRPVFVDESGRRSRRYRRLGIAVAAACAVYAVVIVATLLSGNSNAPWLPVPGQEKDRPAGKVDTPALPTGKADASAPPEQAVAPGTVATARDGSTPAPGGTAKPKASGKAAKPDASGAPKPSAPAATKPKPGVTTKGPGPTPKPSDPVVDPPAESAPQTTPATTPPASEPPATGGGDGGGGAAAQPAGFTPAAPAPSAASPSASAAPSGV